MIGAVSRLVPRLAGSVWPKLRGLMPSTVGEAAFSLLPDLGFAALGAALAPGAVPEIGFTGTSPAERAGIFGYELFANGIAPSLVGRGLGKGLGKAFRVKDYGALMGGGEMALQMTTPLLVPNPVSSGVYGRLESAQGAANEQMIEAEIRRRMGQSSKAPPAAQGIRPLVSPLEAASQDYGAQAESPTSRALRELYSDLGQGTY